MAMYLFERGTIPIQLHNGDSFQSLDNDMLVVGKWVSSNIKSNEPLTFAIKLKPGQWVAKVDTSNMSAHEITKLLYEET